MGEINTSNERVERMRKLARTLHAQRRITDLASIDELKAGADEIDRLSAGLRRIGELSVSFAPVARRLLAGESIESIAGSPTQPETGAFCQCPPGLNVLRCPACGLERRQQETGGNDMIPCGLEVGDYTVQCRCAWRGKVSELKPGKDFTKVCPNCGSLFAPLSVKASCSDEQRPQTQEGQQT